MHNDQTNIGFEQEKQDRWFVPINRRNLVSVFAGGVIVPGVAMTGYSNDMQRFAGDSLLLVRGGLSRYLSDNSDILGTHGFTVLLELNKTCLPDVEVTGLDSKGMACSADLRVAENDIYIAILPAVMPVTWIEAVHFRTESDKADYLARGFDNVPVDVCPLRVSEELFVIDVQGDVGSQLQNMKCGESDVSLATAYRRADSVSGAAAMMIAVSPPNERWLSVLRDYMSAGENASGKNSLSMEEYSPLAKALTGNHLERGLLTVAADLMVESGINRGWQAMSVLKNISSIVQNDKISDKEKDQLNKWYETCEAILENRRDVTPLSDEKIKAGRAILLLLLRPEPSDVLDAKSSSLMPGAEVLALASMLSGMRSGMEALPNEIKSRHPVYNTLVRIKAHHINQWWGRSALKKGSDFPHLEVTSERCGGMSNTSRLLSDGVLLTDVVVEASLPLRTVSNRAEEAGIVLQYDYDNRRLSYRHDMEDGSSQEVYIMEGKKNLKGDSTVRFWSPCQDLSKKTGMKSPLAKVCIELLKNNCSPDLNCRFGISETEKAVVVLVDQISETMDQKELCSNLEHIATTAANFRINAGGAKKKASGNSRK